MHALIRNSLFVAGAAVTILTVTPPMSRISEQIFSADMLQHLLLIVVASPLLVLSGVLEPLYLNPVAIRLTQPLTAWVVFVGTFLVWHWPTAFQWAAQHEWSILLEHSAILCGAFLFWIVALRPHRRTTLSYGARALFIMTAAVMTDLPGVIMLFAPRAICAMPHENAAAFGLTPLEDQQIAGLLMWVPANLVFFGIATWLFALWISDSHKASSQVTT